MHDIFRQYMARLERLDRSPYTIRANANALRTADAWFREHGVDPANATMLDIEEYVASQTKQYAPNTAAQRLKVLRAAYSYAVKRGAIEHNPTLDVQLPRVPDEEIRSLSHEELRGIWNACKSPRERLIFVLLAFTGMRRSEMLNLKFEDVDFEKRLLKVIGKGGKLRYIPARPEVLEAITEAQRTGRKGQVHIIESNRQMMLSQAQFHVVWHNVLERAGIELEQPAHAFRKTVATELDEREVPPGIIDKILGWATTSIREKRYAAIKPQRLHDAMARLYEDTTILN